MKILHLGQASMPALSRELSNLRGYRFVDWTDYIDMGAKEVMKKDLIKISNEMNPDITFLHIQRPDVIDPDFAQHLKGLVVNWTYDVLDPIPDWYFKLAPRIDLTLFCNEEDVNTFADSGYEADFMQIGYDDYVFKREGTRISHSDVVFFGNNYHAGMNYPLTEFRENMVDFLKAEYGDNFKVYGNNWKKYNDGNFMYREDSEAEIYRSSKIGINLSHFDRTKYTSDRMFRMMGCGTMCLTKWYPGIEEDFVDGVHLRVWKTLSELKELIDYYLKNEDERNRIATEGMNLVKETCTWKKRMEQFRNMANGKMSKEYKSRVVRVAQQMHIKEIRENIDAMATQQQTEAAAKIEGVVEVPADEIVPEETLHFTPGLMYLEKFRSSVTNYDALKERCYFKPVDDFRPVHISVIVPVKSRAYFNPILTKHLFDAMNQCPEMQYSITFVEHSDNREHEEFCVNTNYIHIPANGQTFNKCLAFNAGFLFANKASYYMFHDLDIIMKDTFFTNLLLNLKRVQHRAVQTFTKRRVLYCDEALSLNIRNGAIDIDRLHSKYPGIHEPEQWRAPGGSLLVPREQFIKAGGYDPELFFGYSIEDQFFYDKLIITGGVGSCDEPAIEVYHLWHPPLWNSNPMADQHAEIYENFAKSSLNNRMNFLALESNNLKKYIR